MDTELTYFSVVIFLTMCLVFFYRTDISVNRNACSVLLLCTFGLKLRSLCMM